MSTEPDAKHNTIVISGASRGIGLHLAKAFLSTGRLVVGIARGGPALSDPGYTHVRADLGELGEVERVGREIEPSDVVGVVCNAGVLGPLGPFEDNDLRDWVHTFSVNLFGAAALAQLMIPALRRNRGFLIFLSGGGSGFAKPGFSAYGTSKTAVVRLAENLAEELRPDVLVYCVAPGPIRTGMLAEAIAAGDTVTEDQIVDLSYPERLCRFLAENRDPRYSGKFIHVRDDYATWGADALAPEMFKLRRTTPD